MLRRSPIALHDAIRFGLIRIWSEAAAPVRIAEARSMSAILARHGETISGLPATVRWAVQFHEPATAGEKSVRIVATTAQIARRILRRTVARSLCNTRTAA